jgi:hypothetical protein
MEVLRSTTTLLPWTWSSVTLVPRVAAMTSLLPAIFAVL